MAIGRDAPDGIVDRRGAASVWLPGIILPEPRCVERYCPAVIRRYDAGSTWNRPMRGRRCRQWLLLRTQNLFAPRRHIAFLLHGPRIGRRQGKSAVVHRLQPDALRLLADGSTDVEAEFDGIIESQLRSALFPRWNGSSDCNRRGRASSLLRCGRAIGASYRESL